MPTVTVEVLAFDSAMCTSLGLSVDVLRTANEVGRAQGRATQFDVRVVAASGRSSVRTRGGHACDVDGPLDLEAQIPQVAIVPNVGAEDVDAPGVEAALARPELRRVVERLRAAYAGGALVAGSCSGTFALAEAGLLDGRSATTTWWLAPAFRARYPRVILCDDQMVVASGRLMTAGAAFALADLTLALVSRFTGPDVAETVARYLLLDGRPSQARYMLMAHLTASDPVLARAERWARRHLHTGFTVPEVARACGISPRTLARRVTAATGNAPHAWLQRIRADVAIERLQTTRDSLEEVAARVGCEASSLRRLLRALTGKTLREVRGAPRSLPPGRARSPGPTAVGDG